MRLIGEGRSLNQELLSGVNGQFSFADIPPGPFHLTITSAGFASQTFSGTLHSGENFIVPPNPLAVATNITEVEVGVSPTEVAEEQIKVEAACVGRTAEFLSQLPSQCSAPRLETKIQARLEDSDRPIHLSICGGRCGS